MKHVKLRTIVALALVFIMLFTFCGCNYVNRPDGAKNNSTDNNNRLAGLLVKDKIVTPTPTPKPPVDDEPEDSTPKPPVNDEPEDPTPQEPVVNVTTPFNAPGDVITKITAILESLSSTVVDATSATGVKDELMTSRTVKTYMPYELFEKQAAAIEAISGRLNMNIDINIIPHENQYISQLRKKVLSGETVDLMYVDQQSWGYTQHFTQDISDFVNFTIGDKLSTYRTDFSSKFTIKNDMGSKCFVASGIGSPYLLMFTPGNYVVPDVTLPGNEDEEIKELKVEDPIKMFNEDKWCVSAFTEILKASTTNGRVGLASIIDDDRNLDIWMGMEGNDSITVNFDTLVASCDTSAVSREALDSVGPNMDLLQSWYWDILGADKSNTIANWTKKTKWDETIEKTLKAYDGVEPVSNYSFTTIELSEYSKVKKMADDYGVAFDFVSVPYGKSTEDIFRTTEPNSDGIVTDNNGIEVKPYAAGWIGGFAVPKTSSNPAVALRAGEEITKAWNDSFEAPILNTMTEEQQARYLKMKNNLGVSFYRAVIHNARTAVAAYPNITERLAPTDVLKFQSLSIYADFPEALTNPMYRKNESVGAYDASVFDTWSEFYHGKIDPSDRVSQLTNSILPVLSAGFLPPTVLFTY